VTGKFHCDLFCGQRFKEEEGEGWKMMMDGIKNFTDSSETNEKKKSFAEISFFQPDSFPFFFSYFEGEFLEVTTFKIKVNISSTISGKELIALIRGSSRTN
jgi:hypothetical protein